MEERLNIKSAFVPICLYSDGFFLKSDNIKYFLHSFSDYDELLFLIVDKLYGNNLLIKEKTQSNDEANRLANKRGTDVYSFVKNSISDYYNNNNHKKAKITLLRWADFSEKEEYKSLYERVTNEFESNELLKKYSNDFILYNLKKLTSKINLTKKNLEAEYLFGEITMSLFLTEKMNYKDEIWEKPPNPDMTDPINILYKSEMNSLTKIIKSKNPIRNQIFISDILESEREFNFESEIRMRKNGL